MKLKLAALIVLCCLIAAMGQNQQTTAPICTTAGQSLLFDSGSQRMTCQIGAQLYYKITGVSLNSANADVASLANLPSKYVVRRITITNASASLTTATLAVFTGAGGTGTTIVAAATLTGLTGATKYSDLTIALSADTTTAGTLFFRNVLAQGSAATVDIYIEVQPL